MSRTKSIFILSHDQKTTRLIRAFDGAMSSHYSRLQVGTIQGRVRTIPALMHPDATDQDMWRVVNLAGPSGTCFDSVAVLGALDDNQAAQWAMEEFGQYANAHVVQPVSCGNAKGVQYVLDHAVTHEPRMIRSDMLRSASDRVTSEVVLWDSLTLMSHLGTSSGLMRDLSSHDWEGELLDAMSLTDLAKLATDDAEVLNFDALIVQYNKLDTLINRLTSAMAKSTVGDLKVTNVTQSKPFKKNGVAQVAVLFELSDGQTMTILLHNPDSTPTKIAPTDNLTSWKWLLNKRDVSAVVQPKQGENVQMPVLAARMLKIATQNSARFKRTQGKRLEVEQTITDTQTRIQEKQGQLQALNNEIQALQGQIDEGLKAKPVADESVSSQLKNGKAEEWHTDVPTEGLPELKEEKGPYYRVGNIVIRIADDAVKAITKAQKLGNVEMYAYYMPSIQNTGRHGIVRLFPDDQTPGGSWKLLDPRAFYAGMVSDDQIRARLIELLSRAPVIAHGEQGDTGNGAVSGGDPANQGEPTDAQKIKMVDKAYRFASATDEFKIFAADSQIQNQNADDLTSLSVKAEYDPLSTAVAMDKAAKKNGFSVRWQIFTEPGMDDGLMARVYKENEEVGRISMGSDGKAMVYVGASGDTRVTTPSGIRAMFSDDDAPYMIDWLALHIERERDMNYLKSIVNGTDSPLADESRFWHVLNIVEQYDKPLVDEAYAVAMRIYDKFEKQSESVKSESNPDRDYQQSVKQASSTVEDSYPGLKNASVTFDNGQRRVTMTVNGVREWSGGNSARVYFDLEFTEKRAPVASFYEVLSGSTNDHVIEMDGRKFAYKTGVDAMSVSKRTAVRLAMDELVSQLLSGPEMVQPEPASESIAAPEPSPMNPDRDYLQSVIDGKEDLSDADAVEKRLEEISERLNTPELEAMFEKAADAFAAYAVSLEV